MQGRTTGPDGRRGGRAPGSSDVLVWVAVVVDAIVAVVDAFTPVVLFGLLIFGPLVAAFRTRPRTTALVAIYAVALALYEGIPHHFFGSADHLVRVAAIAATGALAVWGSVQREQTARAEARAALLARAGAMLGATPDAHETLQGVADLVVPAAADRVAIDVVQDGGLRRVARAGSSSAHARAAEVVATGEPVLLADPVVLPLRAGERTIGALTIGSASAPPVPGSPGM